MKNAFIDPANTNINTGCSGICLSRCFYLESSRIQFYGNCSSENILVFIEAVRYEACKTFKTFCENARKSLLDHRPKNTHTRSCTRKCLSVLPGSLIPLKMPKCHLSQVETLPLRHHHSKRIWYIKNDRSDSKYYKLHHLQCN